MQLSLGTVQFGLLYGIAGGKRLLSDGDIRDVLESAFMRGISTLDTAPSYGDIEARLGFLCDGLAFRIVSKIPTLPPELDAAAAAQWAINSAQTSQSRLGTKLYALLFHRAEDLEGPKGAVVSAAVGEWGRAQGILIGVSGYDATNARTLLMSRGLSVAQLPGNALDQRIDGVFSAIECKPELYLRSAFLQGLLLLPYEEAIERVPAAKPALWQWRQWLGNHGLSPLHGALSIVKSFSGITNCLVGVDSKSQLEEITEAWRNTEPMRAEELACEDAHTTDPRLWRSLNQ